jgi:hypothetical protein
MKNLVECVDLVQLYHGRGVENNFNHTFVIELVVVIQPQVLSKEVGIANSRYMVEYSRKERNVIKLIFLLHIEDYRAVLGLSHVRVYAFEYDFVKKHTISICTCAYFIELDQIAALGSENSKNYEGGGCGVSHLCGEQLPVPKYLHNEAGIIGGYGFLQKRQSAVSILR